MKIQKKKMGGGGCRVGGGGVGLVGGVRVDVNEELKFLRKFTNKKKSGWAGVGGGFEWGGVQVGEGGVRVDMNEELKFCVKIKNIFFGGGWVGGGQGGCERRIEVFGKIHKTKIGEGGGRVGGGGVRVDAKAMLGVGGDVGYGRCEPRIEDIVQCTQKGIVQEN